MVQKAWGEQKCEKEKQEEAERRQEEIRIRVEAEKALRLDQDERDKQRDKERKLEDWKHTIIEQIEHLKLRRKEESDTKRTLADEHERGRQMEIVQTKRKKIDEKRKKQDLREFLSRQHRLKLLAKTAQVQKDLEDDKRLLEEMSAFAKTHDEQGLRERDEKNQSLTWLRDVIHMQKKEEQKRQKEIEMLFSEEAEKMWHKQEAIWRKEEDARKRLLDDVLDGLKEQIRIKIQGNYYNSWLLTKV
jgi:hypothetical protein